MNKDVTNSPKDWEDFWHSPEKSGNWGHSMTEQSPNKKDLEGLIEKYAWHIIDGLDHKDADQMLFDLLSREYEKYTWDEITEEIVDLYDQDTLIELLPEPTPDPTEIGKLEATAPDYGVGK